YHCSPCARPRFPTRRSSDLVRVAVDREIEEIAADAAVVEEGVALAGRAVAGDALSRALRRDEQLEKLALGLPHLFLERGVDGHVAVAEPLLARAQRVHPLADGAARVHGRAHVDAQRAAVGPQLLDVEDD